MIQPWQGAERVVKEHVLQLIRFLKGGVHRDRRQPALGHLAMPRGLGLQAERNQRHEREDCQKYEGGDEHRISGYLMSILVSNRCVGSTMPVTRRRSRNLGRIPVGRNDPSTRPSGPIPFRSKWK